MKKLPWLLLTFCATLLMGTGAMKGLWAQNVYTVNGMRLTVADEAPGTVKFLAAGMEMVMLPAGSEAAMDTSQSQKDLGIGPVKQVKLGPLNQKLAQKGEQLFNSNCSGCHALNQKKVGPPLGDVVNERSPEFIMNMVLNATDMEKHDPTAERLKSKYHVPMPQTGLNRSQARAVLEYFRSVAPKKQSK